MARQMGYRVADLIRKMPDSVRTSNPAISEWIHHRYGQWQEAQAQRRSREQAATPSTGATKNKRKFKHDPAWAKAKKLCRLNMEEVRIAKELGMNPRKLIKNIPSPTQLWKAPVKFWIRDLYESRQAGARKKEARNRSESPNALPTNHLKVT